MVILIKPYKRMPTYLATFVGGPYNGVTREWESERSRDLIKSRWRTRYRPHYQITFDAGSDEWVQRYHLYIMAAKIGHRTWRYKYVHLRTTKDIRDY